MDWILVTGQPGQGKTTAVKRIVEFMQERGVHCQGFYTDEVLGKAGNRVGFDIVTVPDGSRGVLARKDGIKSKFKTGQYFVDVPSFESLALPSLSLSAKDKGKNTVFLLDEIGRMELHSTLFQDHVRCMVKQNNIRLVGAVTAPRYGHRVPFCDEITSSDGIEVHNLTKKTRDHVMDELLKSIEGRWANILRT